MKLTVITHVLHNRQNEKLFAYAPYVREMNMWFSEFKEVLVVAPVVLKEINSLHLTYQKQAVQLKEVPAFSLLSFFGILRTLILLPFIFYRVFKVMSRADHIHIRCPGNMGLIACCLQIFFPKKMKTAKYAGNWDPRAKQPWTYNLQKWILKNTFLSRNIKVLVYGEWTLQSKNIVPFFTASFSENEKISIIKDFSSPFKFIFVGSLSAGKRPFFAIKLIENLMGKGIPVKLEIYGGGVMKKELEKYIKINNLDPFVRLMGNLKFEELKEVYKSSHFLILASKSEGWPKAIAEAMFFGCVPISTNVSCIPWMLGSPPAPEGVANKIVITKRGISIPDGEINKKGVGVNSEYFIEKTVESLIELIKDTDRLKRISLNAQVWSQQYTLEKFEVAIKDILTSNNTINKKSSSPCGRGGGVG